MLNQRCDEGHVALHLRRPTSTGKHCPLPYLLPARCQWLSNPSTLHDLNALGRTSYAPSSEGQAPNFFIRLGDVSAIIHLEQMSDNKGRRGLGDPPGESYSICETSPDFQASAGNPYDYEQKYEEDRYGEEFGPNARVWRVFLDEGRAYDTTIVKGWRDTLDVYLVFVSTMIYLGYFLSLISLQTGLFSAVVTTFVVQSSQSLQPDYGEINGSLLSELIAIQRALANESSVNDVPPAKLTKDSVTADTIDYLANRFWFASLALSLFAALMAVLMRQWLQVRAEL